MSGVLTAALRWQILSEDYLYTSLGALKIGMDILLKEEGVTGG